MDYKIQLTEDLKVVTCITSGEWNHEVDTAMGLDVMKHMAEWKVNKALIDMRELQFELRLTDLFQRAMDLKEQRSEVGHLSIKVALVYRSKDKATDEDLIFFENVAQNRGMPYRVFKEMDAALEWLAK